MMVSHLKTGAQTLKFLTADGDETIYVRKQSSAGALQEHQHQI